MALLLSAFQLVLRRSLANWRLLSCVVIGVLVAVALVLVAESLVAASGRSPGRSTSEVPPVLQKTVD